MFHDWLFRHRRAVLLSTLLFIGFCQLYFWLFIPFTAFEFNWRPDHQMQVVAISADSVASPYLRAGDHIEAVDGRPVYRSNIYFPPTLRKTAYTLTIERDGQWFDTVIPFLTKPDSYAYQVRAASGMLAIVSYAVGFFIFRYTRRENQQAITLGGFFLLTSVVIISWNATLLGVPFTWLTSQPLLFLLAASQIYIGFLPHYKPFNKHIRYILKAILCGAVLLALVAVFEGIWLFPRGSSFQAVTGISIYQLAALSQLVGGISMFSIVGIRRLFAKSIYLKQQLNILLVCIGIGFLPAALLSFLPLGLFGDDILPIPLAMIFLLIVPLGYLYVIFRRSFLNLDTVVGNTVPRLILLIIFTALYSLSLRGLEQWANGQISLIPFSTLLFITTGLLYPHAERWLGSWIQELFFGRITDAHVIQREFSQMVAHSPDLETLHQVIQFICEQFGIAKATLSLRNGSKPLSSSIQINTHTWTVPLDKNPFPSSTLLRQTINTTEQDHSLFEELDWAEILLPLHAREQILGVLALARPADGFFNRQMVAFLETTAATLAMGSEFIALLDIAEELSGKVIRVQQEEQHHFASILHDDPLQRLFAIRSEVGNFIRYTPTNDTQSDKLVRKLVNDLSDLESRLRTVYESFSPPAIEYGMAATIEQVILDFSSQRKYTIDVQLDDLELAEQFSDEKINRAIYHILRGSLNNVIKHSCANTVQIVTSCQNDLFRLSVNDNGKTVNLPSETDLLRNRHFGLIGMRSWAKMVGGQLKWGYNNPSGACIHFLLPIKT